MSQVQSGILPEHCRAAIWIEANVKGEVDALRAASKTFADKLATFERNSRTRILVRWLPLVTIPGAL